MKKFINNIYYLSIILIAPFLAGCQGGGSSSAANGFNGLAGISETGASESLVGGVTLLAANTPSGGGAGFATIHNPEPATMLLVGGGVMAAALYKRSLKK